MSLPVSLAAACDCPLVADSAPSERYVEWIVRAPQVASPARRPPVSLGLVIDRSGSMADQSKLGYARRAARHVLDLLDERDRVAVVHYDDEVCVMCPSTPVTTALRRGLQEQIGALAPGGCTDLHGGWLAGACQVAENMADGGVSRVLLLTDGLANRGLTDRSALVHQAGGLSQRGVSTSTFGVGGDFDEHLLRPMAEHGGGHYYFIDSPAQIPSMFAQELGEVLTVVARDARLEAQWRAALTVDVLGDLPHEKSGQCLSVALGSLCSGEERCVYLRVLTPPAASGSLTSVRGRVCWASPDGAAQTDAVDVDLRYTTQSAADSSPQDERVRRAAATADMESAASRALQLEKDGRRREARVLMQRTAGLHARHLARQDEESYAELAAALQRGLAEGERKERDFESYRRRHGRE